MESNYVLLWAGIPGLWGITGSAIIVGDGVAVTNRHVAAAASQLAGYTAERGSIPVSVLAVSDRMDLALLTIPAGIGRPPPLARARRGEDAWLMGAPLFIHQPVARGPVLNVAAWSCDEAAGPCVREKAATGLMIAAAGQPGFSGGPVVNAQGQLIGMVQGIYSTVVDNANRPLPNHAGAVFAYPIGAVLKETRRLLAGLRPVETVAAQPRLGS